MIYNNLWFGTVLYDKGQEWLLPKKEIIEF